MEVARPFLLRPGNKAMKATTVKRMKPFMLASAAVQRVVVAMVIEGTNNWCNTSCQIA